MIAARLKTVEAELTRLLSDLRRLRGQYNAAPTPAQKRDAAERLRLCHDALEAAREQRRALLSKIGAVVVSEHAMLRYVERVIGVTREELEAQIVPPKVRDAAQQLGDGRYDCGTHIIVVENKVVRTVVTGGES